MRKVNKIIISIVAVSSLALSVCACSMSGSERTQTPTVTQQAVSEAVKTGVVIEASMHTLTIEAMDGSTYSFITDDNTVLLGNGENLGDTVSVGFEGEYKENILAKKIQIVEKADGNISASATEVKEVTSESNAKPNTNAPKYITGVVTDASMNNITVEWNGRNYTILKTDKTTVEGDITVGATVRIYHTGDIADGVEATSIIKQ